MLNKVYREEEYIMCSDDKANIHKTIDEFYNIISGISSDERDWNKFRSLFLSEESSLAPIRDTENSVRKSFNVQSYIDRLSRFLSENDFFEYGLNYDISIFGSIAHVYSEYEAKRRKEDEDIIKKGITLVQLVNTGGEWKIHSILWQS